MFAPLGGSRQNGVFFKNCTGMRLVASNQPVDNANDNLLRRRLPWLTDNEGCANVHN